MNYENKKVKFYGFPESGNSYKVHFLLHYLEIPHEFEFVDIQIGKSRTTEFLQKNPNGRIPVLKTDEGEFLAESHAILWYLAEKNDFLPKTILERAKILQWMCFEQYNLEPNIAVVRFLLKTMGKSTEELGDLLHEKVAKGFEALNVLEKELTNKDFLVADTFSIADIALFAYTHVAPEGGCSLTDYPNIRKWIENVSQQPGFIALGE